MNRYYNLPPGVTPRMIDGDPDRVSYDEQVRQWFVDHREVPDDGPTYDYVWNRIARDDEPGPDEVLRWIEKQVVAGNLDPVEDAVPNTPDVCKDCHGRGYWRLNDEGERDVYGGGVVICPACRHIPVHIVSARIRSDEYSRANDMAHEPRDRH